MRGVFRSTDLAHLFGNEKGSTLGKRIRYLIDRGDLERVQRGLFISKDASLEEIAARMYPEGYLSLTTALSRHGMIGTRPLRTVDILTPRPRPKEQVTSLGTIMMHVQKKAYHVGYIPKDGVNVATPEKAFIDTCYFHLRKVRFPFSVGSDLHVAKLDLDRVEDMLKRYRNPRFVRFVLNLLESYGR